MRIGEFNRQLREFLPDGKILLEFEESSSSYNYLYLNSVKDLRRTLGFIESQQWLSGYVNNDLKEVLGNFSVNDDQIYISKVDLEKVKKSINKLNVKLAILTHVVEHFSPKQEEQTINIKLPKNINNLKDLKEFNERIENLFKKFNISGDFKVTGFDRGSEWYEIYINAAPLYKYFIGVLSIALSIVSVRKKFFESEIAKINLRMLKNREKDISEDEWQEELTSLKAEEEAKKVVDQLGATDNKTESEMTSMVIKATKELVKELEHGTEFHLSLSPPDYLSEDKNGEILRIDYTSIPPVKTLPKPKKELDDGKSIKDKNPNGDTRGD